MKNIKRKIITISTLAFFAGGLVAFACGTQAAVSLSAWQDDTPLCHQSRSVISDSCTGTTANTTCVDNLDIFITQQGTWDGTKCVQYGGQNSTTVHQTVDCSG